MNSVYYKDYLQLKQQFPNNYARDLAAQLNITEAELLYSRVGHDNVKRLSGHLPELLHTLSTIGQAKAITRNDYVVSIQTGLYDNPRFSDHAGLFLNPGKLDLRMFFAQWDSIFTLTEQVGNGIRHSIQFFDKNGDAIHKVYSCEHTDMKVWQDIIAHYTSIDNPPLQLDTVLSFSNSEISDETKQQIEQQWRDMSDVHQFFTLLKTHNLSRQQVFRIVSNELAWQVPTNSLSQLLSLAHQAKNEIMLFIGNRGCVQIFTGVINKLSPLKIESSQTDWLNVSSNDFNLHIIENGISECWVTRKPTQDGFVTSLEVFDNQGNQIIQMYGQRTEGAPEQTQWSQQILSLPRI
ncbi:ChuX/HutX family heme-like substrate-binding protein [Providencia vermicola]|uniref:hemin-degrading factor n=1 Tax=Providencia vermicola TaxID=333965 RepID=UPI0032DA16AB